MRREPQRGSKALWHWRGEVAWLSTLGSLQPPAVPEGIVRALIISQTRDDTDESVGGPVLPLTYSVALKRPRTFDECLQKHLGVMDASAIALARDNDLPIIVFSLDEPGGFCGILRGEGTYTRVQG